MIVFCTNGLADLSFVIRPTDYYNVAVKIHLFCRSNNS